MRRQITRGMARSFPVSPTQPGKHIKMPVNYARYSVLPTEAIPPHIERPPYVGNPRTSR